MAIVLETGSDYFRSLALLTIGGGNQSLSALDLGLLTTGQTSGSGLGGTRTISLSQPDGNDQRLMVGEQFTVTNTNVPLLGSPTTTTLNLTLVGSGTYSALLSTSNILVAVDGSGNQYVIFPDGDMPTLTGTVLSTINVQAVGYDFDTNAPLCFTRGVLIETVDGPRAIETLKPGDLVLTKDNGARPIAWIGHRSIGARALAQNPELAPIRIKAGALGKGIPEADLIVSPQHRILVRSRIAQRMFDTDEILVAAKLLLEADGIDICEDCEGVEYFHLLFDQHEVVFANGAEAESLYTGPQALKSVSASARIEIFALFPQLRALDYSPVPARIMAAGKKARQLASRHMQNGKFLVN
jgi:hypothetical protein